VTLPNESNTALHKHAPATLVSDKSTLLAKHFLFSQLRQEDLEAIVRHSVERQFDPGQIIFQKGEAGGSLMLVVSGLIRISANSEEGKEITLNTIKPGGIFGEIAFIDGKERSADATALEHSNLLIIRRSDFLSLLKKYPDMALELLAVLCQKLRNTSEIAEDLGLLSISARLAHFLLRQAESHGVENDAGIKVDSKLSQREIGNRIGATRESVNKKLAEWQRKGYVLFDQGFVTIVDEDKLEDIAAGENTA
jgi:CRP/FNR family transcriptional regulator, cyclic AMP receptor protein